MVQISETSKTDNGTNPDIKLPLAVLAGLAIGLVLLLVLLVATDLPDVQYVGGRTYNLLFGDWHTRLFGKTGFVILVFPFLLLLEAMFIQWHRTAMYRLFVQRSHNARIDLAWYALIVTNALPLVQNLFTFGLALAGVKASNYVSALLGIYRVELPSNGIFGLAAGFAVFWTVQSFGLYWSHRISHLPLFWHLHRFHHAATEMNMVTVYRFHPAESILNGLAIISPAVLFHASEKIVFASLVVGTVADYLAHTELPWTYGWIGRWFLFSPAYHQIHHSIDAHHMHKNFATMPLWDRLFGTLYLGDARPTGYGITDQAFNERPLLQGLLLDSWRFYNACVTGVGHGLKRIFRRPLFIVRGAVPPPQA